MNLAPTRTLVLVNLLALAGLAYLWVDPHGQLRNMTWIAPAPIKPVIATPKLPEKPTSSDPTLFAATLERPLFAPDRRPPPPVLPPPPPPPPDPLADAHLLGLISGEAGAVLIRADGKVRRVTLKKNIGDWTLQAIEGRTATFARGTETRIIKLEYARLADPTPPPPPRTTAAAGGPVNRTEASRLQAEEEAAKNTALDAMRARMSKKAP